jgi:hypothetical protein
LFESHCPLCTQHFAYQRQINPFVPYASWETVRPQKWPPMGWKCKRASGASFDLTLYCQLSTAGEFGCQSGDRGPPPGAGFDKAAEIDNRYTDYMDEEVRDTGVIL